MAKSGLDRHFRWGKNPALQLISRPVFGVLTAGVPPYAQIGRLQMAGEWLTNSRRSWAERAARLCGAGRSQVKCAAAVELRPLNRATWYYELAAEQQPSSHNRAAALMGSQLEGCYGPFTTSFLTGADARLGIWQRKSTPFLGAKVVF